MDALHSVVHLVLLAFVISQMHGIPLYEFPLIVAVASAFAMGAALCPRPLGAYNARDVFCDKVY